MLVKSLIYPIEDMYGGSKIIEEIDFAIKGLQGKFFEIFIGPTFPGQSASIVVLPNFEKRVNYMFALQSDSSEAEQNLSIFKNVLSTIEFF